MSCKRPFGPILLCALSACGTPSLEDEVSSYLAKRSATVRDCGEVTVGQCITDSISEGDRSKVACLADCGTRLAVTQTTIEGAPIYRVFVRTGLSASCTTAVFTDDRADAYAAAPTIARLQCELAATTPSTCSTPVPTTACKALD